MGQPGQFGEQPQQWPQQPPPGGYPGYPGRPPPGYGYAPPGYGPPPGYRPPAGHLGWAIAAVLLFWPLAIPAFINYSRVEGCFYRGDLDGAVRASQNVKRFGLISVYIGVTLIVLWIIFAATLFASVSTCPGC